MNFENIEKKVIFHKSKFLLSVSIVILMHYIASSDFILYCSTSENILTLKACIVLMFRAVGMLIFTSIIKYFIIYCVKYL